MLTFKEIAKIFEEIELRLISSLKQHLAYKKQKGDCTVDYSTWRLEKLRKVEQFRKENAGIMAEYASFIDDETRRLMEEQFSDGEKLAEETIEAVGESVIVEAAPAFSGVDKVKLDNLIQEVTTLEKNAETAALRMTDDVYRQTLNRVQLAMASGEMPLNKAIDLAVKDFLDKGLNSIVYKDGRRVNIADYVRMALRTTSTRAQLQGQAKRANELGYDTVRVSQYEACSDTCLPWQGRVYIDDVFSVWEGERSGDRGRSNYCGKWFPLLSSAIRGGLFHPNCRHTISVWIEGRMTLPKPLDVKKIKERSKLEQNQRRLENEYRKAQRKTLGLSDPENIKKAKDEEKEAERKLSEFIKANSDTLKRDYDREKVYSESLDKSSKIDIIESGSGDVILENQRYGRNKTTLVNKSYIESGEYKRKYDNATDNQKVNRTLYDCAKTALKHRSGTAFEDMYWIDSETGKIVLSVTDSSDERAIIYTDKIRNTIKNNKNIVTLHTHPSSMPPSVDDFNSCLKNGYNVGFVACHNGKVFKYSSKQEIRKGLYNLYVNNYINEGLSDFDAQLKTLEKLKENHEIMFVEVL